MQSHPRNRTSGKSRSVSDPRGGCARPCRCGAACKDGSVYAGYSVRRPFFQIASANYACCFTHNTEQTLRTAGVAPLPQPVPQLDHAQRGISAAHVADKFQLGLRVLVGMAVGASGLAGKGRHTSVPSLLPEIDVRPALVVLPAGAADAVFLCVLH